LDPSEWFLASQKKKNKKPEKKEKLFLKKIKLMKSQFMM